MLCATTRLAPVACSLRMLRATTRLAPVACSLGAASTRPLSTIRRLGTDDPRSSAIVVHSGTVYLTGQVDVTGTNAVEQMENCLAKVDTLLATAGTDKSRLLTAMIWLKNIDEDFAAMNGVWNAWVDPDNKPVRACVESRMARSSILVEVQCTAAEGVPH